MSDVELQFGSATDVGRVREVNEDSCLARPPVFVVADGMGGHEGGDVASRIVVDGFARMVEGGREETDAAAGAADVARVLRECQREIREWSRTHGTEGGGWHAGTTAVVALLVTDGSGPACLVANLGDSRAYRLVGGELEQVSVDHSVVQELVDAGEITETDADHHPERHVITRALGGAEEVEADYFLLPARSLGRLLLCSDGVSGMLTRDTMQEVLAATADPGDAATRIVAAAVDAGGEDNATAVVVDVVG